MRKRLLAVLLFAFSLVLALTWGASAQGPVPAAHDGAVPAPEPPMPDGPVTPRGPNTAAIALGQPGTVFRYIQTFGTTGEAYPNPGTSHLNSPSGLYIDGNDNLYVVEEHGYRLLRYTAGGVNTLALGTAGLCIDRNNPTGFCVPQDVALDGSGNIWLATDSRVAEYDTNGVFLRQLPVPDTSGSWSSGSDNTHFNSSTGVAFDSAGHMFVSDGGNHRIQVYAFSGGAPVYSTTIGLTGVFTSTNAGFNSPRRITVDSINRLFVADANNGRVQRCVFSSTWSCTTLDGGLSTPRGVGIDGADNIYIADSDNRRVVKCNSGGSCSDLITNLLYGVDVAVDSGGNVYLDGWGHGVVRKYNSSGSLVGEFVGVYDVGYITNTVDINSPWGMTIAADGSIYVTEHNGYRVLKLNAAGVQQWAIGMPGALGSGNYQFNTLQGKPAVTADNRVLVPDAGNSRIQVYGTNGVYQSTFGSFGTSGNDKFNGPNGIGINPTNGDIYVADGLNQRVQVYDSSWNYKATIGVPGSSGGDNTRFNQPRDVAIDASGNSYVADRFNRRIQKCSLSGISYACTTFAGITGSPGSDFDRLNGPTGVALDSAGRVYVVDENNHGVQIYDVAGAYLTTVGYSSGASTGQMRNPSGVALDSAGNLYVADRENHRIQKFAPGVPGWRQVNINGFGNRGNYQIRAMTPFGGQLFAGTSTSFGGGAQLWSALDGTNWKPVLTNGFGISTNVGIDFLAMFNNRLYAGTADAASQFGGLIPTGGELWRSDDGIGWTRIISQGFGTPTNEEVEASAAYSNVLYVSTASYAPSRGSEIWRSNTGDVGDWTRVISGFGDPANSDINLALFQGMLYGGTLNGTSGAQLWRTGDGLNWTPVMTDGFGNTNNNWLSAMTEFGGYFYASARNFSQGAEVWRSPDGLSWSRVLAGGAGNVNNVRPYCLVPFNGKLYLCFNNSITGNEIWSTSDGTTWQPVITGGWGDSNNIFMTSYSHSVTTFNGKLYFGTRNSANGGEVWELLSNKLFLPEILR